MQPPTSTILRWRRSPGLPSFLALLVCFCWATISGKAQFSVPDNEPVSGLVSNGALGRVYVSAGAEVYSLSQDLQELDQLTLDGTEVSGMAVNYDGQWLVVCSLDSFCRVVNGSALNAAPNIAEENAIAGGTVGVAVFTDTGNTFYTGGVGTLAGNRHVFGQFGFAGNNLTRRFTPIPAVNDVTRLMYGGFYRSPYAYYVAVDAMPGGIDNQIRIVRVCNESAVESTDFDAVYEVELDCDDLSMASGLSLAGVSLVDGVMVILGVTSSASSAVCLYNLSSIDDVMDSFYQDCLVGNMGFSNNVDAWDDDVYDASCSTYTEAESMCDFGEPSSSTPRVIAPSATNYMSGITSTLDTEVIGIDPSVLSGLTQSMAIVVDEQTILYLGYTESSNYYLIKYHLNGTMAKVIDSTSLSSAVTALSWSPGSDFVYVATEAAEVVSVPLENCSSYLTCNECAASLDPLCGWCSVEAKCSRVIDCQNSDMNGRYIENGQTGNCFDTVTVDPTEFITDLIVSGAFEVSLSFSPGNLPQTLPGETYFCRFNSSELSGPFATPLVNGACDVEMLVNQMSNIKLVSKFTIYSDLTEVDFITVRPDYSFINCSLAERCSVCVDTNGTCGWCALDFLCTANGSFCSSGDSTRRTLSTGQTYIDVCPLLLPFNGSSDNSYSQPVNVARNLKVFGKNFPDASYRCYIGQSTSLEGTRQSEGEVDCVVMENDVVFDVSSNVASQLRGFELRQLSPGGTQPSYVVETPDQMTINVNLYECSALASHPDCSLCLAQNIGTGFVCGWCPSSNGCEVDESCTDVGFATMSGGCPPPEISTVDPNRGPPQGGTTIVIGGSNLGVSVTDISSITVGGVGCNVDESSYIPGQGVTCVIRTSDSKMEQPNAAVAVTISRVGGMQPLETAISPYRFLNPVIESVSPSFGPLSGGTMVMITGTNLDIGNYQQTKVQFLQGVSSRKKRQTEPAIAGMCSIRVINSTTIECVSGALDDGVAAEISGTVQIIIDNATVTEGGVTFEYKEDPVFEMLTPQKTIPSGGINLTFHGTNLDIVQFPLFEVTDSRFNQTHRVLCEGKSDMLLCIAPELLPRPSPDDIDQDINYTIIMDNAMGPDITQSSLVLTLLPNPSFNGILDSSVPTGTNSTITITGEDLESVDRTEISVTVGEESEQCVLGILDNSQMTCTAPLREEAVTETVYVHVGILAREAVGELMYFVEADSSLSVGVIAGTVVGIVVLVALVFLVVICFVLVLFRQQSKLKDQKLVNLLSQMETMELDMADQCKQAFAELQTELEEIVSEEVLDRQHLPFHDFPRYAMKVLFPSGKEDHPVLHPPKFPPASSNEEYTRMLEEFRELIFDKKFLVTFIRTLEAQQRFTLSEKCTVASLLMVTCQGDLVYATDILQTLLGELIRRNITQTRSNPKLLLRRTESVAEKLLANWFCFLLYPYMLDHAGAPLFILFKAVKRQLEKGPIDVITGEARNSLSEEKLLRQALDFKTIECEVETNDPNEVLTIKLLDTDSISQTKEKLLDLIYRNTHVSQRPSIGDVELELCKGNAGIVLRDHDSTSRKDQEWVKINTLGHFGIPDMAEAAIEDPKKSTPRFRLGSRNERPMSVDYCDVPGTIISSASVMSTTSLLASAQTMELGARMYHLVKPDAGEEATGKIVSEVFLTRLLSTKRILQQYVDNLFHVIFAIPHGKPLPKAIKFLFDFLDMQAASMGISDPDILHTWKTNSLPLRFWVNLIKNPDFVFDINKSATVDACLTIIAQAYIDACSTSDFRYTKDTPSARLLYANEVKQYKEEVLQYYNGIQSQPNLSTEEMNHYLTDIQQEFQKHQHFCPDSAILELYRYAQLYGEELVENLSEDGLALMAAQFGNLRRKFVL